jgi:hypothetical protein
MMTCISKFTPGTEVGPFLQSRFAFICTTPLLSLRECCSPHSFPGGAALRLLIPLCQSTAHLVNSGKEENPVGLSVRQHIKQLQWWDAAHEPPLPCFFAFICICMYVSFPCGTRCSNRTTREHLCATSFAKHRRTPNICLWTSRTLAVLHVRMQHTSGDVCLVRCKADAYWRMPLQ